MAIGVVVEILAGGLRHSPWGVSGYYPWSTVLFVQAGLGGATVAVAVSGVVVGVAEARGSKVFRGRHVAVVAVLLALVWLCTALFLFNSS